MDTTKRIRSLPDAPDRTKIVRMLDQRRADIVRQMLEEHVLKEL